MHQQISTSASFLSLVLTQKCFSFLFFFYLTSLPVTQWQVKVHYHHEFFLSFYISWHLLLSHIDIIVFANHLTNFIHCLVTSLRWHIFIQIDWKLFFTSLPLTRCLSLTIFRYKSFHKYLLNSWQSYQFTQLHFWLKSSAFCFLVDILKQQFLLQTFPTGSYSHKDQICKTLWP